MKWGQLNIVDDGKSFTDMIRRCTVDYPAQIFVGVDSENRPSIVAVFDDARGHLDFGFWLFSSDENAQKAFEFLKQMLDVKERIRFSQYSIENPDD